MMTRDEAQKLAAKVLGFSTFPECHATITSSEQAYTRFANNGITTASLNLRHTVSIVVTRDGRTGAYGVNDLDDASLRTAVAKAEELAVIAPPNPERLPDLGAQQFPETHDLDEATAAARAPDSIVSLCPNPGSRRCTWMSIRPGATINPFASISSISDFELRISDLEATIFPSAM